jgi:hypothetical protein
MGDDSELHNIQFLTFNFMGNFIGGFLAGGTIPAGAEHDAELRPSRTLLLSRSLSFRLSFPPAPFPLLDPSFFNLDEKYG